jgi:hypothetical protein
MRRRAEKRRLVGQGAEMAAAEARAAIVLTEWGRPRVGGCMAGSLTERGKAERRAMDGRGAVWRPLTVRQ